MDQEKIGKLIAKLRKSKGLTQSELGEMVGVGFRAVSKWENGITSPDISIINDLSKILGISADELLKGEIKNKTDTTTNKFNHKKLLYVIPISLIIILVIIIININNNKTEVYKLAPVNSDEYYIDGEITFKDKYITININKLGFADKTIPFTKIKNYQYELYLNQMFLVGYGNIMTERMLSEEETIESWVNNFKINYNGKLIIKNNKAENNKLILKIILINVKEEQINKEIKIKFIKVKK